MTLFQTLRTIALTTAIVACSAIGVSSNVRVLRCKTEIAFAENQAISDLLANYPEDFHVINDHLVATTGEISPLEYATALEISKALPDGRVLVLTPSAFGQRRIPSVDGVIYSKEGPITNISIKSVDMNLGLRHDFIERMKRAKNLAQSSVKKTFNLKFFANLFEMNVSPSGLLVSPHEGLYYRRKDERLNKVIKFLGLFPGQQRRVTVAVGVGSRSYPIKFKTAKDLFGDTNLQIEGQGNRGGINLDKLVDNLKYDREIAGYIFVSSFESVFVDARKFVFRATNPALLEK